MNDCPLNRFIINTTLVLAFAGAFLSALLVLWLFLAGVALGLAPALLYCSAILLGIARPRLTACLFLLCLPLFGQRPGSQAAFLLFFLSAGLQWPMLYLLSRPGALQDLRSRLNSMPGIICCLYILCSFFSLSGLPLQEVIPQLLSSVPSLRDMSAIGFLLLRILRSSEEFPAYSILSILWTLMSFNIALLLLCIEQRQPQSLRFFASSILAALLLALAAGLADYYGLINLSPIRPLDPVVNPHGVQFRLQSFFAHSGWFAEFLTLTVPFVLLLLLLRCSYWLRLSLILAILLALEFALVLTFQRGGWVSYPLTLFVIWAALYITHRLEKGELDVWRAFRASLLKIVVTLPLTLLVTFGLLALILSTRQDTDSLQTSISRYTQRFAGIRQVSDRSGFIVAGFRIGSLSPFLGTGSESFAFQFQREFRNPQGRFHGQWDWPLYGSAHNVYAQTFAGKGAAGLMALVALALLMASLPLRAAIAGPPGRFSQRVVLLSCACFAAAFLIYGNVQEVFYVQPLQFYFFAVVGLILAALPPPAASPSRWPAIVFITALSAHFIFLTVTSRGMLQTPASAQWGCFAPEQDQHGRRYRWCGPRSRTQFNTRREADGRVVVRFQIQAAPLARAAQEALQVSYRGRLLHQQTITPGHQSLIAFTLPDGLLAPDARQIELDLRTALYFIPARAHPGSGDLRALAFRLLAPDLGLH